MTEDKEWLNKYLKQKKQQEILENQKRKQQMLQDLKKKHMDEKQKELEYLKDKLEIVIKDMQAMKG